MRRSCHFLPVAVLLFATVAGCGPAPTTPTSTQAPAPSPGGTPSVRYNTGEGEGGGAGRGAGSSQGTPNQAPRGGSTAAGNPEQRRRQAELLERIRRSDPQNQTIDRAFMNEDNDLGVILDRQVQMSDVPKLLRALLTQLAKEFPNENLDVIAYAPAQPPLKIGTAHLEARTREMTYTAARR